MFKPVVTVETPPGAAINAVTIVLVLLGLALSLRWREEAQALSGDSTAR